LKIIVQRLAYLILLLLTTRIASADDAPAAARRQSLMHSYGTYDGDVRTPQGRIDHARLLAELGELHANCYNWLITHTATDWDDLHTFLPLAHKQGISVWVTVMPPSESPPGRRNIASRFDWITKNGLPNWLSYRLASLRLWPGALMTSPTI